MRHSMSIQDFRQRDKMGRLARKQGDQEVLHIEQDVTKRQRFHKVGIWSSVTQQHHRVLGVHFKPIDNRKVWSCQTNPKTVQF